MDVESIRMLERLLAIEGGFSQELEKTPQARRLHDARDDLLEFVRTVGRSGDLQLIVTTERAIVEGDLLRYANSQEMAKSLGTALSELAAVEKHMALVADPVQYRTVNEAHSLPRNRRSGLPYDEARQAMASHYTRLGNMDKSRLTADEKAIITARKKNVEAARKLYERMQAKAIGMSL